MTLNYCSLFVDFKPLVNYYFSKQKLMLFLFTFKGSAYVIYIYKHEFF